MSASGAATGKREPIVAAALLAAMTFAFALPSIRGVDGAGNYVFLMSLLNDGDLDFANEYAALDESRATPYRLSDAPINPRTGRPANRYGVGAALFWAPAVGLVHGVLKLVAPELATGLTPPYAWAVALSSAFWGGLGLWLIFMRLREGFGSWTAWLASAGVLLATPLGFYLWGHPSMSHAVSFFVAALAMLSLERAWEERSASAALAAGLWAGLLTLTRIQDATWTLVLGLALALFWPKQVEGGARGMNRWAALALFALAAGLVFIPQMAVWNYLFGSWLSGPLPYLGHEGGRLELWPHHLAAVLVSERGGVFAWHPILLMGFVGLFLGRDSIPKPLRIAALVGVALQILLISSWSMWWGGASFGNRFFISSYPFFAWGLAHGLQSLGKRAGPRIAVLLVVALVAWNAGLLIQYGTQMISREDEVGWGPVLKNQFTAVPQWLIERAAKIGGG